MSVTQRENKNIQTNNNNDTPPAPYYDCNMERPFGLDKRISTWFHLSMSHIFGLSGFYLMLTGVIPRSAFFLGNKLVKLD
jgi:hypothetical protein